MPSPDRRLDLAQAADLIAASAVAPGSPGSPGAFGSSGCGRGVGLELEMFPFRPHDEVRRAVERVHTWPGGSRITFEPGGQVELSGPCFDSADDACDAMARDMAVLARGDLAVAAVGMHPDGGRPRVLDAPRYEAMEAFFDGDGPAGRTMMRDTAALQVNVDCGRAGAEADRTWRLAHALGPVLAAAFANSPVAGGRRNGWRSNRLRTWLAIDRSRTAPVGGRCMPDTWAAYALGARVMMLRLDDGRFVPGDGRLTLGAWVQHGHELGWPTADDVAYHLTTLFPPVRPRGFLELRFLDALPSPYWHVAAQAACRLLDGADGSDAAEEACVGTERLWLEAARDGLAHPVLRAAAERCLAAVPEAAEFVQDFTAQGRCPGDQLVSVVPA